MGRHGPVNIFFFHMPSFACRLFSVIVRAETAAFSAGVFVSLAMRLWPRRFVVGLSPAVCAVGFVVDSGVHGGGCSFGRLLRRIVDETTPGRRLMM